MMRFLSIFFVSTLASLANASVESVAGFMFGDKAYIKITGPIDEKMSKEFSDLFASWSESPREIEIYLNSGGGKSVEGLKMIALLEEKKSAGAQITTIVKNGNICGSLCVPLYVQGQIRKAGPASSFMFHSAHLSFGGTITIMNLPKRNEEMFQIFLKAGVSAKWLDHMKNEEKVFESDEYYWLSGSELQKEKSGVVTELLLHRDEKLKIGGFKIPF